MRTRDLYCDAPGLGLAFPSVEGLAKGVERSMFSMRNRRAETDRALTFIGIFGYFGEIKGTSNAIFHILGKLSHESLNLLRKNSQVVGCLQR